MRWRQQLHIPHHVGVNPSLRHLYTGTAILYYVIRLKNGLSAMICCGKAVLLLSTDDQKGGLCQSLNLTIDDVDDLTLRTFGQTRHTHDVARNGHNHS